VLLYKQVKYSNNQANGRSKSKKIIGLLASVLVVLGIGIVGYNVLSRDLTVEEVIANELIFNETVTEDEKTLIKSVASEQLVELTSSINVIVDTKKTITESSNTTAIYVPVTTFNSVKQSTSASEIIVMTDLSIPATTDPIVVRALAEALGIDATSLSLVDDISTTLLDEQVAFIPLSELNQSLKLLAFDGSYYLDDFTSGALFRSVELSSPIVGFKLPAMSTDDVYKVNMTGVTALTRVMQRKLTEIGGDPLYFSAKIGDFLADADLTHVSNEVSFKENCPYSNTLFCSPPEFIETLKASGVDLVELTGNHNNDLGSELNTQTIELYRSLGWNTIGGGLNTGDAALPFISSEKESQIAFLAYNFPDSPNGRAIAGANSAGANSFDFERIEVEIAAAKQKSDFVIVNVQYWECYSYPDGYIEFPSCDKPIGEQEPNFKKLVDLGADMVIGSSAHQPQTYELYNDAAIYYGLGNLYFDQTSWPGTERGIVLTHYFMDGALLQTKLTPTVFDRDLQTRVSTAEEAEFLLARLQAAR